MCVMHLLSRDGLIITRGQTTGSTTDYINLTNYCTYL